MILVNTWRLNKQYSFIYTSFFCFALISGIKACEKVLLKQTKKAPASIKIVPYCEERDQRSVENIVEMWEQKGDPLQTNWWTVLNYRLPSRNNVDVARYQKKTIGFISYFSVCKSYGNNRSAHIDLLAVKDSFLRNGCGRKLLQHVVNKLHAIEICNVTIHVQPENRFAIELYKSEGFRFTEYYAAPAITLQIFLKNLCEHR